MGYLLAKKLRTNSFYVPKSRLRKSFTELFILTKADKGWISYEKNKKNITIVDWETGIIAISGWSDVRLGTEIRYKTGKDVLRFKVIHKHNLEAEPLFDSEGRRVYNIALIQEYVGKLHE